MSTLKKRLSFPSAPKHKPMQRYAGRFWDTHDIMELLSIHHGATAATFPKSWQYRTLIAFHRARNSANGHGKGYGPDWKSLKKVERSGKTLWVPDNSFALKGEILEYLAQGRIPVTAVQFAAEEIRKVERELWVKTRVVQEVEAKKSFSIAAE